MISKPEKPKILLSVNSNRGEVKVGEGGEGAWYISFREKNVHRFGLQLHNVRSDIQRKATTDRLGIHC